MPEFRKTLQVGVLSLLNRFPQNVQIFKAVRGCNSRQHFPLSELSCITWKTSLQGMLISLTMDTSLSSLSNVVTPCLFEQAFQNVMRVFVSYL